MHGSGGNKAQQTTSPAGHKLVVLLGVRSRSQDVAEAAAALDDSESIVHIPPSFIAHC